MGSSCPLPQPSTLERPLNQVTHSVNTVLEILVAY